MRIHLAIFLALGAVLGLGSPTRGEGDVRRMLRTEEQPQWLAIGRLNVSGQGFCTATLIAPDLVLTAAHCLLDKRTGKPVRAERVHFLAGYRTGAFAAHGRADSISVLPGYRRDTQSVGRDVGLVRLSDPVPATIMPIIPGGPVEPGQILMTMSYGIDRSQIASMERACKVRRRSGTILYTSCEGVAGVSGAPVLIDTPDGLRVIAVASAVRSVSGPYVKGSLLAVALSAQVLAVLGDAFDTAAERLGKNLK